MHERDLLVHMTSLLRGRIEATFPLTEQHGQYRCAIALENKKRSTVRRRKDEAQRTLPLISPPSQHYNYYKQYINRLTLSPILAALNLSLALLPPLKNPSFCNMIHNTNL